jgi:hypothetical protein
MSEGPRVQETGTTTYRVVAYRNRSAYYRGHGEYSERAATREEAEAVRKRLAEEAWKMRIGWRYIDIRAITEPSA